MKNLAALTLLPAILIMGGCASTNTQMVNDKGQVANCSASGWGLIGAPMALASSQDCVAKYQAVGFHEAGTPGTTGGAATVTGTATASVPTTPTTVVGQDGFFKITLPAGWMQTTPPSASYQLAARNPAAETYLMISSVKTADIADWLTFSENLKAKLISNLAQSTSSETAKIKVNGFDALQADIAGTLKNGVKVHYLGTIIKTDQNLLYLLSWTTESKFVASRGEFEALPAAMQM